MITKTVWIKLQLNVEWVSPDDSQNSTEKVCIISSIVLPNGHKQLKTFHISLEQFTDAFFTMWEMAYSFLKSNFLLFIEYIKQFTSFDHSINGNAYLMLVLVLLGKHNPGVTTDPLICTTASSNWKAAFGWTREIRVKNTMGKYFFLNGIFTTNGLVNFLKF